MMMMLLSKRENRLKHDKCSTRTSAAISNEIAEAVRALRRTSITYVAHGMSLSVFELRVSSGRPQGLGRYSYMPLSAPVSGRAP